MSYLSVDQMTAFGDLRIVHGACQVHVCAVLDLITTELSGKGVRIQHVVAPAHGRFGLAELISQLAGNPPSQAVVAPMPLDGDVKCAHRLLTELDDGCDRILLLIEGAQSLQPSALRYIQHVSRTTPHLRLALVGADRPARLCDPEFAALSRRAATELRLDEHAVSAEASWRSALSSVQPQAGAMAMTLSSGMNSLTSAPPRWMTTDLSLAAPEPQRRGGRNWAALAVLGLVALSGTGAWWHHLTATGLAGGIGLSPVGVSEAAPNDRAPRVEVAALSEGTVARMGGSRPGADADLPIAIAVVVSDAEPSSAPSEIARPAAETVRAHYPAQPPPAAGADGSNDGETSKPQPSTAGAEPVSRSTPVLAAPEMTPAPTPEVNATGAEAPVRQDDLSAIAETVPQAVAPDVPPAATPAVAIPAPATEVAAGTSAPMRQATAAAAADVARADRLLDMGDVSGARRWYEYAAAKGSAIAATSLGKTYDPNILARRRPLGGIAGEPGTARFWYEKGAASGDPNAASLLAALNAGH